MEGLTELAYKRMYKKYKTDFINEFRKDPRFEDGSLVWSDEYAEENFNAHMEIRGKVFDSFPEEVKSYLNNKDCMLIGYCSTKEKTILRLLCEKTNKSLPSISRATLIPLSTLKKYNISDEYLYKTSFQNIAKLVAYFDVTYSLFKE